METRAVVWPGRPEFTFLETTPSSMIEVRKLYCRPCGKEQQFQRPAPNTEMHRFLTILTLGLWGVGWLAVSLYSRRRPWQCSFCWHRHRGKVVRSER